MLKTADQHRSNPAPERIIRIPEILARTGLSRGTIWRKMRDKTFPRGRRIGAQAVGILESEFQAWLSAPENYRQED